MLRYFLQGATMLGDLILFGVIGYMLWHFATPIIVIFSVLAWLAWKKQGGFEAWQPSVIKQFMHNAKQIGL